MPNYCKECQASIKGRSDKLFCNNYCRTAHHNNKVKEKNNHLKTTISVLVKNREILKKLNDEKQYVISKKLLENKGFNVSYFTSFKKSANYDVFFCFEFGIKKTGAMLELVKSDVLT